MILYYIYIYIIIYVYIYIEMHIVVIYNYCLAMVHWNITNETLDKNWGIFLIQTIQTTVIGATNWDGQLLGVNK